MKKIYLLACLLVTMISCQKEDITSPSLDTSLHEQKLELVNFNDLPENILKNFDESNLIKIPNKKSSSPFGKLNKNKKVKKIKLKGTSTYTFSLNIHEINKSQEIPEGYFFDNLVIKDNPKKDNESMVIRYQPSQAWLDAGHDFENYSGKITFYSIEGEKLNSVDIQNNENSGTENINNKQVCPAYLMSVTYSCSGQEFSMQENCHWIYTYRIDCTSGGSGPGGSTGGLGDNPNEPDSIPSVPTESNPDYDTGSGGGPNAPEPPLPLQIEVTAEINVDLKNECQNSTIKIILEETNDLIKLINSVFDVNNVTNLVFQTTDISNGNPVFTDPTIYGNSSNYHININYDNTYLASATDLSVGANAVHEMTHAYFINLYITGSMSANSANYNDLLNAFINFYDSETEDTYSDLDNEIHNSMNEFIDNMGRSIFAYSQKKGYSASPEYCQKLAWSTMYGTDLFQQILTNQQQQEYGNIGAREQDNQNYQEEDPKGEDRNDACN